MRLVLSDVIMRITFLTFLRVAASWSFIAMAQRTSSTAPTSGSLGLEPRPPPARDHAANKRLHRPITSLGSGLSCLRLTNHNTILRAKKVACFM